MLAVQRCLRLRSIAIAVGLSVVAVCACAQSEDLNEHLRDEYQGRILALRGFYAGDLLRYDSSGSPDKPVSGDWTDNGFVRVTDIQLIGDKLIIDGQRMVAAYLATNQFELRPLDRQPVKGKPKEPDLVKIKADVGMHNPAPEQLEALVSKIFLTPQDSLADLVPDYWKSCLRRAFTGAPRGCAFSPEILAIPGAAAVETSAGTGDRSGTHDPPAGLFRVGNGISPPRVTNQRDPEFSESARVEKFQGVVVLMLVVDKEGMPGRIRIEHPLGYGLDAKAVEAVQNWKFVPAQKDGVPVNVEIAVEVEFQLY